MNHPSPVKVFTVGEITGEIKKILEKDYRFIRVVGEISNLKTSFAGHSYFTLKDNAAQLQAVVFKQHQRFIDTQIADGQKVLCFGRITVYEPRGSYQLVIDSMEPAGEGKIRLEFEKTKARLAAQGYFAEERKQKIPKFPGKIAVITSPKGAAIADFLKIITLRKAGVHIQIYPVSVQGENAVREITSAIKKLDQLQYHDVLVLIRGGGSLEDLQAFNDRQVAEAIFSARLPIVTGIGHQVDFTIADFCADYRSPTPTAAAEYLVSDTATLQRQLKILRTRILGRMRHTLDNRTQYLHYQKRRLGEISGKFIAARHRLNLYQNRIKTAICNKITAENNRLTHQRYRVERNSPQERIEQNRQKLFYLKEKLEQEALQLLTVKEEKLQKTAALLHGVSPLATLARGYSITRKTDTPNLPVISSANDVFPGEQVEILLHQGRLECEVKKILPDKK